MPDTNILIIGAGVIGLAIAAELSKNNHGIYVIEKYNKFGQETSSRNSEVIHSGIYYPTGSLKATLCVKGREMLYDYCQKKEVQYNKCGKLIVATNEVEEKQLVGILKQSQQNGVTDGELITKERVTELEPHIRAQSALYFPSTGIIDTHGLMKQLETDAIINGVEFAYNSEVVGIKKESDYYKVEVKDEVDGEKSTYSFTSNIVINASGLHSDEIAAMVGLSFPEYKLHYWKGEYFGVGNGKHKLVNHLIYPVPNLNITGLGVHGTLDLNGALKLGPNTIYLPNRDKDYSIDINNLTEFHQSASTFMPFLEEEDLHPDQAGIRPKLQKPGDPARDFIIKEETDKGFPNFINLIGIESPGITASLAIAAEVEILMKEKEATLRL